MQQAGIERSQLVDRTELRRNHLLGICKALTTYIERDLPLKLTTVGEDEFELFLEAVKENPAVVFTIEDWEAFRLLLEPGVERVDGRTHRLD